MLTKQLNQVLSSNDENNVPLLKSNISRTSTKETERKQIKQGKDCEEMLMKKKSKLEWRLEDYAHPIGKVVKFSGGEGENKKFHYETFEFYGKKYGLEDSVLLNSEDVNQRPFIAIIKDIYVQGKEGFVKLEVQWLYRPEDVDQKDVGDWKSKDSRYLFYSFHRDEVFAETVKHSCIVHFVPENKQIPNRREHPGFIVQNVYDIFNRKLRKFNDKYFNKMQKLEFEFIVSKTISRIGDLPDIHKEKKRLELERKSILEKFGMLTGDSDRDKRLKELLIAVKHKCRTTKKQKANDYDSFWPNDAVHVVCALEQVLYDSSAKDMQKYNRKLEVLVEKLKRSRLLAERLLIGELKPEQIIKMTRYELMNGHTFDEIMAEIDEPLLKTDPPPKVLGA